MNHEKKNIIRYTSPIIAALIAGGLSYFWDNYFVLFVIAGCIVGFCVRISGERNDNDLVVGAMLTGVACFIAIYIMTYFHEDVVDIVCGGEWLGLLVAVIIGGVQSKFNEFLDD